MIGRVDKRALKILLQDEIEVRLLDDKDKWGKIAYQEPFTVDKVRFDRSTVDKSTNTQSLTNVTRNRSGIIYIYPEFSKVTVNDSWLQAEISDLYGTYKVVTYNVNHLGGKVFSYEVEVV